MCYFAVHFLHIQSWYANHFGIFQKFLFADPLSHFPHTETFFFCQMYGIVRSRKKSHTQTINSRITNFEFEKFIDLLHNMNLSGQLQFLILYRLVHFGGHLPRNNFNATVALRLIRIFVDLPECHKYLLGRIVKADQHTAWIRRTVFKQIFDILLIKRTNIFLIETTEIHCVTRITTVKSMMCFTISNLLVNTGTNEKVRIKCTGYQHFIYNMFFGFGPKWSTRLFFDPEMQ